jgi:hypothetical protein
MKKITFLLLTFLATSLSWSQCVKDNAFGTLALANDGTIEGIAGNQWSTEHSEVTGFVDGDEYVIFIQLNADGTNKFVTISELGNDANVLAFGQSPFAFTGTAIADLKLSWSDDPGPACEGTQVLHTTAVQNLTAAADACPDPINFAASNITDSSADLAWLEQGISAVSYNVEVYLTGQSAANGDTAVFADAAVSGLSVMATGLAASTGYDAYIMTTCSGATTMSMLVGPVAFTTTAACADVSGVGSANIVDTAADITWTPGTGNDSALVEVYAAGESAANGDTAVYSNAAASGGTDMATGLMADTAYDAFVTGMCGAITTATQGPSSFTTSPPAPVCGGLFVDSGGSAGTYSANETTTTTITPDNAGDVVTLTFTQVDIEVSATGAGSQDGCWDYMTIYNGPDNTFPALAVTLCGEESGDGGVPSVAGSELNIGDSFTSTDPSGALTIEFTSDGSVQEDGWSADVTCAPPAECLAPTGLAADMLTENQIDFSWNDEAGATLGYEIEIGAPGFTPGTGAEIDATTTAAGVTMESFASLTPSTDYEIHIRSNCDANGFSSWAGPLAFTTLATPPANDNLCSAQAITLDTVGTSGDYTTIGATAETSEPVPACFNAGINGSVWFSFVAPASGEVEVSTDYTGGTLTDTEIAVYDATGVTCTDLSTLGVELGCDQDGGTDENFNSVLALTGLTSGGTYYVQVDRWGTAADGTFGIQVFDQATLGTDDVQSQSAFTYFPNPVKNTLTLNAQNTIENVRMYNMLGQEVLRTTPNTVDSELDMSSLQNGTYFVKVTIASITKTIKVIKH